MKSKRIVVLLKYFKGELNPFDGAALECALETGSMDIIAVSMAPMSALNAFQSLTRLGIKGVFITDPLYAGSDTQATSFILAEALKRLNPDLIFCGRQSVDGDTAQVPPMIAQRLGFAVKTKAISFVSDTITLRNGEDFVPQEKTVITFEKIRTLRFPSIFSKLGEVEIWDNSILQVPQEKC
jgi:electron transfer flavoprotein beta subunit